jgi:hypothetical protein
MEFRQFSQAVLPNQGQKKKQAQTRTRTPMLENIGRFFQNMSFAQTSPRFSLTQTCVKPHPESNKEEQRFDCIYHRESE